ncbi:hypothetical protein EV714DRAFT_212558 [Schizophyllum commune]
MPRKSVNADATQEHQSDRDTHHRAASSPNLSETGSLNGEWPISLSRARR